jgi:hypothetical protein
MKKLVNFVLIFAMLVPLSLAVAADSMSAPPTVEEMKYSLLFYQRTYRNVGTV